MSRRRLLRYRIVRDDESSLGSIIAGATVGALAGFAVGMVVAQKVGGISGLRNRLRDRFSELRGDGEPDEHYGELGNGYEEDELDDEEVDVDSALEERVLRAFQRDPVLSERAIDIGSIGEGIIELAGWVDDDGESELAMRTAQEVPGVTTVVNRLVVGDDDDVSGDDTHDRDVPEETNEALPGGRWLGQRVGTGRPRQGHSGEPGRHADPKPELEQRWLDEQHAIDAAAGDLEGLAERRRKVDQPAAEGRADGSPLAPSGVPKGDHVADPQAAKQLEPRGEKGPEARP